MSSSLTILMICWAGLSAWDSSAPSARSRTRAVKTRTAGRATSASSSARRICEIVSSTSSGVRRPLPRRDRNEAVMRSESVANTSLPFVGVTALG